MNQFKLNDLVEVTPTGKIVAIISENNKIVYKIEFNKNKMQYGYFYKEALCPVPKPEDVGCCI